MSFTKGPMEGKPPPVSFTASEGFVPWLLSERISLAFTTYQTRKFYLVGASQEGRPSFFERTIDRVMGMAIREREIYLGTRFQIWRFRDLLHEGQTINGFDALYTPRESHVTGDLDIHDLIVEEDGRIVFVNTLFNCLATIDRDHNFRIVWMPPWISGLAGEDRCHLNGLAKRDGVARYVTSVSRTDRKDGWREVRHGGGVVYDIVEDRVVCEGLSMPHSPRWHDGRLWLLNSGTGWLGWIDPDVGEFNKVAFCPGYARGLSFYGNLALVGLSDQREDRTFKGLPLHENLEEQNLKPRCALHVINTETGGLVHGLGISGLVRELYDVGILRGVCRPMSIGFQNDEIHRVISVPPANAP